MPVRAIAGHIFDEPRRESMIWIKQLRLSSTQTRVAQPLGPRLQWRPISDGSCKLRVLEGTMDTSLVSRDPEVMSGALCFKGTRVPVKNLFDYLEGASTLEDFLEDFPSISRETAISVLEAARARLAEDATAA